MTGKIIYVGFEKTGTTSLGIALKMLGYSVKEHCPRALMPILKGNYIKVHRIIRNYDAVADKPWFKIYKELDNELPGSKFILTIRDESNWYNSVSRHFGILRTPLHEWIYGRGNGIPKENKQNTIKVYSKHNQEVINYFKNRPNDLLILDLSEKDIWEKLCDFLGHEIPQGQFPHSNKNATSDQFKESFRMRLTLLRRKIKNYILIRYIDLRGYW